MLNLKSSLSSTSGFDESGFWGHAEKEYFYLETKLTYQFSGHALEIEWERLQKITVILAGCFANAVLLLSTFAIFLTHEVTCLWWTWHYTALYFAFDEEVSTRKSWHIAE